MKKIETVTITVETNMDADDYGHRIAECVSQCNPDVGFINLVKVDLGEARMPMENLGRMMQNLKEMFVECGASNCVFVPIGESVGVRNITIDHLKVVNDDSNE